MASLPGHFSWVRWRGGLMPSDRGLGQGEKGASVSNVLASKWQWRQPTDQEREWTMRVLALAAVALMAATSTAQADSLLLDFLDVKATFNGVDPMAGVNYSVQHPALTVDGGSQAGSFNWTRSSVVGLDNDWNGAVPDFGDDFITFCIELDQTISSGSTYVYEVAGLDQAQWQNDGTFVDVTPLQATNITKLWSYALSLTGFADKNGGTATQVLNSKAMQLAAWEVVYEDGTSPVYDLSAKGDGSPGSDGISFPGTGDAKAAAQSWLDALPFIDPGSTVVKALLSTSHQDQGFLLTGSPANIIPLPVAAWSGMLLLAGLTALRRARPPRRGATK